MSESRRKAANNRYGEVTRETLFNIAAKLRNRAAELEEAGIRLQMRRGGSVRTDGARKPDVALQELNRYLGLVTEAIG